MANSLQTLDNQLSHYAHLRTLDLSYNRLDGLPSSLPRSLWDLRVAGNHIRSLDKNDTAYHWNLQALDLSANELERVVFINNTLPSLRALNLSHNHFWTVPTNMPHNLETVDLSHNYLTQILPGSLGRLPRLARFYLHANRFASLPGGIFDKLAALDTMTLGDNPWACEDEDSMARLLTWAQQTRATVAGCPCYTRPVCGDADLAATLSGREFDTLSLTEPPAWVHSRFQSPGGQSPARTADATSTYRQVIPALFEAGSRQDKRGVSDPGVYFWASTTSVDGLSAHASTTASPRPSTTKTKVNHQWNSGPRLTHAKIQTIASTLFVMATVVNTF